jgi:hypothetical protein
MFIPAKPMQYAVIMEAKPAVCDDHGGEAHAVCDDHGGEAHAEAMTTEALLY